MYLLRIVSYIWVYNSIYFISLNKIISAVIDSATICENDLNENIKCMKLHDVFKSIGVKVHTYIIVNKFFIP